MTQFEQNEINTLPEKYRPMGAWSYFGYSILFSIPIVGLILLIVFAVSDSNINRRSYARSFFCIYVLFAILFVILMITGVSAAFIEALAG